VAGRAGITERLLYIFATIVAAAVVLTSLIPRCEPYFGCTQTSALVVFLVSSGWVLLTALEMPRARDQ
jgi:hypothetical protein